MRAPTVTTLALLTTLATAVLIPPGLFDHIPAAFRPQVPTNPRYLRQNQHSLQSPMNPGPALPADPASPPTNSDADPGSLTISDILPKTRSINIFASLTRDVSSVSDRLDSSDNTTLLAPLNSVMQNLPRKPWEDRPDDDNTVSAARNEDKAAANLRRFVEEHVIPTSPWKEGKDSKVKNAGGQDLWWESRDGKRFVMPGNLEVDGVVGRVGNGEIWAVKGVVNYA